MMRDRGQDSVLPPVGAMSDFVRADMSPDLVARAARDRLPLPDMPIAKVTALTTIHYSFNVFHSHSYIRDQWGRFFPEIEIRPLKSEKQCVVLRRYRD
jgi:hypothetical protein